ncbi:MAG: OmpA family protein [Deltaproteobacteria bacterium]|nr:OmpA family protein [Deltaproteobacteria bacterium]
MVMNSSLQSKLGECELSAVYFDFDESTLSKQATGALAEMWKCLSSGTPFKRLVISGHTDERGTTEYNLALGNRRAEAVRKYLTGLGAEARKLKAISFGEERPVAMGSDEEAWAKNRRVELTAEK